MVTTIVNPQAKTKSMSNNSKTKSMSNNANVTINKVPNNANVTINKVSNNANVKKANKINAKTAIPFKNLRGGPNMVKKQPPTAIVNKKSRSISGGFNLSPLISAILLAGIKLSLNQNKKLVDKSKSTKSTKSTKSSKSTKSK